MLKKSFLLSQYDDWTQHLADLNAQEKSLSVSKRAENRQWAGKGAVWRAHYAKLLQDAYGHEVAR